MQQTPTRPRKEASPARWQLALRRALAENIKVVQVKDTGQWIATSGSEQGKAYVLEVVGGLVRSCSCAACEEWKDPVCKHRAKWFYDAGLLDVAEV